MGNKQLSGDYILECKGISKRFGGVQALDDVGFNLKEGEVHALVGENGAGKSTLIKILCGLYQKDSGTILYRNEESEINTAMEARKAGIGLVPQLIELAEDLTVAENIYMGIYPRKFPGIIDWKLLFSEARRIAGNFNMQDMVRMRVGNLGSGHRQMIEILKSLTFETRIIAFDEPTASLSDEETRALFQIIRDLKSRGISIIYVSHRLEELFQIADRLTVFKDGRYVDTRNISEVSKDEIVSLMVGRELNLFGNDNRKFSEPGEKILEVKGLNNGKAVSDVSFTVRKHEILGMFGMVGSGRTESVMAAFGADHRESGEVYLDGKLIPPHSPASSVKAGFGLVPEDRIQEGVILGASIRHNITLPFVRKLRKGVFIDGGKERSIARDYIDYLKIKTPDDETSVVNLSGGNQQKVSIAKWLASGSDLLVFDEPTHGIDVGAKHDIYQLLRKLSDDGKGVVVISSEIPEVLNLCDRILIFRDGRIVADLLNDNLKEKDVVAYALG